MPQASKTRASKLNGRNLTAPLAAFTMACLLFAYARSSISAARRDAQKGRYEQLEWQTRASGGRSAGVKAGNNANTGSGD